MKPVQWDVMIAGGGVAGCCAAVSAARSGARTLLVEGSGQVGGTGYAGLLQHICGLYLNGEQLPSETLNKGLTGEIVELLKDKAPSKQVQRVGQVHLLPYEGINLRGVLDSLIDAEANLEIACCTVVSGAASGNGRLSHVIADSTGGERMEISANMFVDCTGNGDLAAMAGAEFEFSPPGERQLAGYIIRLDGIEHADETLSLKVPYYCAQGIEQGHLPMYIKFTTFHPGERPSEGFLKMNPDGEDSPGRDQLASGQAGMLLEYLSLVLPHFRNAVIIDSSHRVFDREGRRVMGEYMLTEEDILSARKFPDAIVKNAWPIELWDRTRGVSYRYVPRGDYYEIPLRCITVRGIANLLTAGRCISVSHGALGSTRVMGCCMALGEQAGKVAAHYAKKSEFPAFKELHPS